jgi:cation-transporting ATPase E
MSDRLKEELNAEIAAAPKMEPDFLVGLSAEQVASRKHDGLVNKSPKKVTKTYWQIFCDNFFSFFNLLLLGIAVLMLCFHVVSLTNYFFVIVLLANMIIGLITDIHARHMVDRLRVITDPKATTVRDGQAHELEVNELVLSDIVLLKAGDQICADAMVVHGSLKADESLITGESEAVCKRPGDTVYSGSFVKSGSAYVRVTKIGVANYAEGLQDSAKKFDRPRSEIKRSCTRIFWATGIVAVTIGFAMLVTWLLQRSGDDYFSAENLSRFVGTTSASMIAMIPSGLYLLSSMTLATGVIRLAKKHMSVQELYCIEMLARVDVVCFDKTGTLTDGKMSVSNFYNFSGTTDADLQEALSSLVFATKDQNPTALALKEAYKQGARNSDNVLPFDSEVKYSAASFTEGTWILGAYGFVEANVSAEASKLIEETSKKGQRTICLYFNKQPIKEGKIPAKSTLMAVITLTDHIKSDAAENIKWFLDNGVAIKIISGDNPTTVSEIAGKVGVPNFEKYISMEGVKDSDIPALVNQYAVFGRVNPNQKALLISALQKAGHKVAMTGDGVNDIIALKTADCSIAMASGSSAARNVAHMVSLDNDFSKLPSVVAEGRRVINNLQRTSSLFLSKTIFAIVISAIFLISSWAGGDAYPFYPRNMLIWEIVTIGGGGFFLALQPSSEKLHGTFMSNILSTALPAGIIEIASVIIFFLTYRINPTFMSFGLSGEFAALRNTTTISVVVFTILSYLVLFRICWPFDTYRALVFGFMILAGAIFYIADIFSSGLPTDIEGRGSALFGLYYEQLSPGQYWLIVGAFLFLALVYLGIDWFFHKNLLKKEIKI